MKKIAIAFVLVAGAAPALAADLGSRSGMPGAVMAPLSAPLWTGFYAGAHLGYGFGGQFDNSTAMRLGSPSGVIGGLQAGFDSQFDRFVLGLAGDVSLTSINRRFTPLGGNAFRANENWMGSVRARAGYTVQDNLLIYGTAGLAFGSISMKEFTPAAVSQTRTAVGWTAGFGGEYMVTRNVSALVEYRYTDLGRGNFGGLTGSPRVGYEGHSVRVGANYRF